MSSPHSDVLDGATSTQISTNQIAIQENNLCKKVKNTKQQRLTTSTVAILNNLVHVVYGV